jgi:hypothetical protein
MANLAIRASAILKDIKLYAILNKPRRADWFLLFPVSGKSKKIKNLCVLCVFAVNNLWSYAVIRD